ncbi:MAG TPA: cytochrome c biogenesis protein CcdA [Pirellulales bacterium]|nr:cytochrome c biogenesis protein CcdA [Pirellulales bacterium]
MRSLGLRCRTVAMCAWLALNGVSPLWAQKSFLDELKLDPAATAGPHEEAVAVSASFTVDRGGRGGKLSITAKLAPGYHIYSITQPNGGPIRTKIKLEASRRFELTGDFEPTEPPAEHLDNVVFPGVPLEEHEGVVTWTAPIRWAEGVDPSQLAIAGKLHAQACNAEHCDPPTDFPFKAALAVATPPARKANATKGLAAEDEAEFGEYADDKHVAFRAHLEPKVVEPGGKARLVVTAEPDRDGGWHIYAVGDKVPELGGRPTLIVFSKKSGLVATKPVADSAPSEGGDGALGQYGEPVTWTIELTVPQGAKAGGLALAGIIGYQVCTDSKCELSAVGFEATLTVGRARRDGRLPVTFTGKKNYGDAEKALGGDKKERAELAPIDAANGGTSLLVTLGFALIGGLILNLMPCVLPVIGLKILSFVEQSGHDRRRVLWLNVWYSLGLISVFMALATATVVFRLMLGKQFSWGQQFTSLGFNVGMASLVFVMALSFLGVWEIPIPGFVGGGKANELAAKEGAWGAFLKGVLTTILATPCSGPYLGVVFAFAVAQPPPITYLTFGFIGLGMASPYLLIGVFPGLIHFLPKPGAWMDTFKQLMGFVLLGTVVWLFRVIDRDYFIPALAFLFGLWFAFWWIGRTPLYAELRLRLRAWGMGAVVTALAAFISFGWLAPRPELIAWQPFSIASLTNHTAAGKTVLLDFTALW